MAATVIKTNTVAASTASAAATVSGFPSPGELAVQLVDDTTGGTWSGTVTFEVSVDGTNWVSYELYPSTDLTATALTATATADGVFFGKSNGFAAFRARLSTATSGTVNITARYAAY
jgi:hypothetical protein